MISDIKSLINGRATSSDGSSVNVSNLGTIAKLSNEMKLIENLSLIKFQGSETTLFQGKPVQLLHASSQHQPFTLINHGTPIDITDLNNVKLNKVGTHQATLQLPADQSATKLSNQATTGIPSRTHSLNMASQVIQLTVVSSLPNSGASQVSPSATAVSTSAATTNTAPTTHSHNTGITTNQANIGSTSVTPPAQHQTSNPTSPLSPPNSTSNHVPPTTQSTASQTSPSQGQATSNQTTQNSNKANQASFGQTNNGSAKATSTTTVPAQYSQAASSLSNQQAHTQSPTASTSTQALAHAVKVTDGQTEFQVISQTPLKKGDTIRVFVDANNQLQALPAKEQTSTLPIQTQALRQSLPKQLPAADMTRLINQLQTLADSADGEMPPRTQEALKQLVQHLPSLSQITSGAESMKQAMQVSGLFSESLLLNDQKLQIPADLKLNLERLKDSQEMLPTQRSTVSLPTEQIASAIERITTNQLRHLAEPGQINTQIYPLQIEIPIKEHQQHRLIQVEIDKDPSQSEATDHDRRWLVKLQFDFEETGRFDARTSIQGNKVGILFAAESLDTVQKLQRNMPNLKDKLSQKDIEIERIDAFQANLKKAEKTKHTNQPSLIDVRT
ncbi:flagellar hook-length control protein FliK [Marinomonas aquiplantarum]|uniref:Flagellar hook-length control protein FliK n=1 Tax=Marinomonas aquiplantarum TaxID=491951 RepID=A0A366CZL0_9GAMM|nr:flagellar hook-length control protein FliK [Marinomonas aquiplantarum]RBO83252.1 flagellar hook-length control protein FliK [Marinomonas aquiplantarum]